MNDLLNDTLDDDLAFFEEVSRLLDEEPSGAARSRRRSSRSPFEYVQLLAYYNGRTLPGHADFQPVRCCDLSPGGFSFLTDDPPPHPQVVVALGVLPFSFFMAKIQHVRTTPYGGDMRNLVGCRFTRRILTPADVR
ncbi:MAG: hypothetical protein KY475_08790 [Planctomycetes bacterium]|nr:hypothetical protein [Planctomycetota bacterium]